MTATPIVTAVMGPSGSGKSTLMHVAAGLDTVTGGRVLVGDTDVTGLNDKALTRRKAAGDLAEQLICDHALFHLEADLRWLELTAARLDGLAQEVAS